MPPAAPDAPAAWPIACICSPTLAFTAKNLLTQLDVRIEKGYIPINAHALALVQIRLSVTRANALGMACLDKTVKHIGNHVKLKR